MAAELGLPYIELDALSWKPNWVETPKDEFRSLLVQAMADNPNGWVIDGNYGNDLKGLVAKQADTVVYVNISWLRMLWRINLRSFKRARDKKVICGENVETWRKAFFSRDSLLWFLIRTRKNFQGRRTERLRQWSKYVRMIELDGARALDRFYEERGLVRRDE